MHVPVYWPEVSGIQPIEYKGVVEEVKNVIAMDDMPIMSWDVGVEGVVELPIDMPDIVLLGAVDIDIVIAIEPAMVDVMSMIPACAVYALSLQLRR